MSEHTNPADPKPPSVDRLSQLWRRINDHKMVQWSVAYVALAYGVQHGVELTSDAFEWPHVVVRFSMLLLVLGLPLVTTLAWYQGERASGQFTKAELSILSALLVIGSLLFYQFVQPSAEVSAGPKQAVEQASVAEARSAAAKPAGISVAVLPFVNLSSDKEQEFFADGITEEITAALAKVPDLKVVARTSAFEFKGKNVNIRTMGEQLGATHLIEGSVRKAGDRVRITAQLIKADDGTHLWAEDYDRQLTDIFQIQEDIARAIASALRMPLGLKPGQNLVSSRNISPAVYQEFLRIRAKQQAIPGKRLEAIEDLEKLLARAPKFAKALAFLSQMYLIDKLQGLYSNTVEPPKDARQQLLAIYDKAEKAAREAIRLDEAEVLPYATLAEVEIYRNNYVAAEDLLRKGLNFDPYDPDILVTQAAFWAKTGRMKQALPVMQELHDLEPLSPDSNLFLVWEYVANNQPDAAITLLPEGRRRGTFVGTRFLLASAYAMKGQFDKAADIVLAEGGPRVEQNWGKATLEDAARLLRSAPQKVPDPKALPPLHEELSFIYFYVGAEDRLLEFAERSFEVGLFGQVRYLFNPVYSPARKTERFKTLVRKAGLVDYWKARGWPDMCHPTASDDFECE